MNIEQPEKSTIVESKPSELAALWTQVSIAEVTANAEQEEHTPWRGTFGGNNRDKRDHTMVLWSIGELRVESTDLGEKPNSQRPETLNTFYLCSCFWVFRNSCPYTKEILQINVLVSSWIMYKRIPTEGYVPLQE